MKRLQGAEYHAKKGELIPIGYSTTKAGNICIFYKGGFKHYLNDYEKSNFQSVLRNKGRLVYMKEPTEKQLALIKKMEQLIDVKFNGNSIQEASQFISKHMEKYQEEKAFVFEMVYNENNY